MADTPLSPRTWVALAALIVVAVGGLIKLGDPEPALPRCTSQPVAHVRCRP